MALRIRTDIPYGNVVDTSVTCESGRSVVSFSAHPHGGLETLWFCFRIEHETPATNRGPSFELVLKHVSNLLGGLAAPGNFRPVARYDGGDWERLDAPARREHGDGRVDIAWNLDEPATFLDVAVCYPYGMPEVEDLLRETGDYYRSDVIGVSQGGRPMVRLSNGYGGAERLPGLFLFARQHSGETSGSWVLDGFLRGMAELATRKLMLWAIPLTNIDGVEQGDYGKDNFPWDLNRAWDRPPMRHEVHVMQFDTWRWKDRCRPALVIDFHAPGACENDGLYIFAPSQEQQPEAHAAVVGWAAKIETELGSEFTSPRFARVASHPSRWGTPTLSTYAWKNMGVPGLSLETPYALIGGVPLTRERYREAGRRMARVVARELEAQ